MSAPNAVPTFFIYGEPARPLDVGFLHVETVMARRHLHSGMVEPHRHDRMGQITFWTKGQGTYLVEDEVLDFSAMAASFIPSGVVHGFHVEPEATDAIVISIADSILPSIADLAILPLAVPTVVRIEADGRPWDRLSRIMHLILEEYAGGLMGAERIVLPLIAAALAEIARLSSAVPGPTISPQRLLASRLRQLVDLHFREQWPIQRYVESLHTTSHLLAKACETAFGLQPKQLIIERRLLEAKRLLLFTIRSVEDIAFEIGMKDAAYFSRFFRQHIGEPPGEWRRRQSETVGDVLLKPFERRADTPSDALA